MTTITWTFDDKLPDGHRLFSTPTPDERTVRYAIADDSGDTPDQTDDGVLWLDFTHNLSVGENVFEHSEYISIPLITPDGQRTRTTTNMRTALALSARFEWPIYDDTIARDYHVTKPDVG